MSRVVLRIKRSAQTFARLNDSTLISKIKALLTCGVGYAGDEYGGLKIPTGAVMPGIRVYGWHNNRSSSVRVSLASAAPALGWRCMDGGHSGRAGHGCLQREADSAQDVLVNGSTVSRVCSGLARDASPKAPLPNSLKFGIRNTIACKSVPEPDCQQPLSSSHCSVKATHDTPISLDAVPFPAVRCPGSAGRPAESSCARRCV